MELIIYVTSVTIALVVVLTAIVRVSRCWLRKKYPPKYMVGQKVINRAYKGYIYILSGPCGYGKDQRYQVKTWGNCNVYWLTEREIERLEKG